MSELPDKSVQCVVTSPPYWGLRKYSGEQDLIWGGDEKCEHQWVDREYLMHSGRGDAQKSGKYSTQKPIPDMPMLDNTCSICGAWKGSYGLEPTPEMYIQHTVEIMREIRRVLRKDGVVFWNIGDSYNSKEPSNGRSFRRDRAEVLPGSNRGGHYNKLKPKDLCLIPFRVAQEVQKPYYTGKIKDENDRIWLASMIDGEGCLFIHKRKVGQNAGGGYKRKHDTYGAGLEVANTHLSIINRCRDITGIGREYWGYRMKEVIWE